MRRLYAITILFIAALCSVAAGNKPSPVARLAVSANGRFL